MHTRFKFVLCIIITLLIMIIIGCLLYQCDVKIRIKMKVDEADNDRITHITDIIEQVEKDGDIEENIINNTEENIENKEENIEDIIVDTETDKDGDINQAEKPINLGNFRLTAYCSCSLCCGKWANNRPVDENGNEIVYGSIGERLTEGYSIAVDPTVIPYGTEVIINGHTYKAQDCGSAIKGNRIDIYMSDHNEALKFGVQYADVFIIPE